MPSTETAQPTPATDIAPGNPVAIYAFFWEAGSGGVYIGKHEHPEAQQWPESGEGRLPSGYGGGGKVIQAARRAHGDSAFRWRLLEVVPAGMDWEAAERRWVAWGREQHGERCRNLANGGEGLDSEAMREMWAKPEHRKRVLEALRSPECLAKLSYASREFWKDPAYRERVSEASRVRWGCPRYRKQMSEARRGQWRDPETRRARHLGPLKKRLSAAQRRRDAGQPPHPLDNLCLSSFDEPVNPLLPLEPRQPKAGTATAEVLVNLSATPEGLSIPELCAATGRAERGAGSVRQALDDLRRHNQPIINEGGRFRLLRDEEWRVATD